MRRLHTLFVGLLLVASVVRPPSALAQCTKDTDCKGDRICVKGTCVAPQGPAASPSPSQDAPHVDQGVVKSYLEQRVTSESGGALKLEAFQKTNGFEEELTHLYVLEWQGDLQFLRQGWKPGDAIGGYWNDFQVLPAQSTTGYAGFLSGSWLHFDQGTRLRLRGNCTMRRTEQGWRIEHFSIKSYLKLAESAPPREPESGPGRAQRTPSAAPSQSTLEADIAAGRDVRVPVKYNSATYGYTYMADGNVTLSKAKVAFTPTYGSAAFSVTPDNIRDVAIERTTPESLHVRVSAANAKGKVRVYDYYWYPPAAKEVGGGPGGAGATIDCSACDNTLRTLEALLKRVRTGDAATSLVHRDERLMIAEPTKDFGTVPRNEPLNWTFQLKNTGTADLEILAANPLCGCTQATFSKVIKPGEIGHVTARVDISSFKGPISKVVEVTTNDPSIGTRQLTIKATVTP